MKTNETQNINTKLSIPQLDPQNNIDEKLDIDKQNLIINTVNFNLFHLIIITRLFRSKRILNQVAMILKVIF